MSDISARPDPSGHAAPVDLAAVVAGLRRELAQAVSEREEARAWVRRITASERVVTCAFCGEAYPPGTPESNHERLLGHVRVCTRHPMREAEAEVERLRGLVKEALTHVGDPAVTAALRARIAPQGAPQGG